MRAVRVHEHGGYEVLRIEEVPDPVPRANEALVRLRAAGVNHLDTWVRRGVPGHKFPLPITLGCDGSGVVESVGEAVETLRPGDAVLVSPGVSCGVCRECLAGSDPLCRRYGIVGETRDGTCAERIALPARNLLPKPETLSFEEAASIPLVFLTAWHMVVERAKTRPGDWVLVRAAASGVGSAAVQIAKLFGATVVAEARSQEKAESALALGADHAIDSSQDDVLEQIRRLTGKRGVDVVIEHVGEATWDSSVRALARGGRLVTCGATSGFDVKIDLRVLFFKNIALLGSTMGSKAELIDALAQVAAGRLRPVVHRVLPLEDVALAHRMLAERRVIGKLVLSIPGAEA